MIPVLYDKGEEFFTSNGICRLVDCISCEVTEERNGIFEVEFQYPVNGLHFDEIRLERIIYVTHDETKTPQPFDIYKKSAEIDGVVTFNASHISYRLGSTILQPFTAETCVDAMDAIGNNALNGTRFNFWTDKNVTANFELKIPQSIRATLSGVEGSILDVYGTGEYEFDKWTVKLYSSRGADTAVQLRYGKNLTSLTADTDISGTYNACTAYWQSIETGEIVAMPGIIVADSAEKALAPWTDENDVMLTDENGEMIDFGIMQLSTYVMDLSADFTEKPTVAALEALARQRFAKDRPWETTESITVDFVQLWQTEEYADVAPLQRLTLCDTAVVLYPQANVNVRKKVIKVVYDALLERYSSMELGTPHATLSDSIRKATLQATVSSASSMMQQMISQSEQLITGGLGGYVVLNMINDRPAEILVLDTPDIASAVNVIRINENGIGFSQSGYDGPYRTAWTIDGRFNADFIATGQMSANQISGGLLRALDGASLWNLDTGRFVNESPLSRVVLSGGQIYFYGYDSEAWGARGSIRTIYGGEVKGVALKADAVNMIAALAYPDSDDNAVPVFVANSSFYKGYFEHAIIAATVRLLNDAIFNASLALDYEYGNDRIKVFNIGKTTSGYWGTGNGVNAGILGDFFSVSVVNSSGNHERVMSVNGNTNTGSFGFTIFHKQTKFLSRVNIGDSYFTPFSTSDSDASVVRLTTKQLILDRYGSLGVIDGVYGLRIEQGAYVGGAVNCASLTQRSDERLKDFMQWDDRYDNIFDEIEPQLYTWKDGDDKSVHIGLSAQKLKTAIEKAGIKNSGIVTKDEYFAIAYTEIPLLMMRKIKKQQEKIESLEAKLETLERKFDALCRYMNYLPEQ